MKVEFDKDFSRNTQKSLFSRGKPVIRPFKGVSEGDPGDIPYAWDAYLKGVFDIPEGYQMGDFMTLAERLEEEVREFWIVEDWINGELKPVAFIVGEGDWLLEPHVQFMPEVTPRIIYRVWVAFLKKCKYRKDIGACMVRCEKNIINLANRMVKLGLLEFVGKVWGGSPDGNLYLYSVRSYGRRH